MTKVLLLSTSTVRPKIIKQPHPIKIHLNPFDFLLFKGTYPKMGILFPKPDQKTDIISQLKTSLSLTLEIFYPFVGRIVNVKNKDETMSFYIDCDGSNGVKFVHAMAKNVAVRDIVEPANGFVPNFMKRFFLAHEIKSYQGDSNPLIAIQVTELKDGVFLGCSVNHLVTDWFSMWDFINTWSKICSNGLNPMTRESFAPIHLREWFLDNIDYPIHIPNSEINACSSQKVSAPPLLSPLLREKIFRFTKYQISKLKEKVNEEIRSSIDVKISSFQAVLGYLWRSIITQSGLSREREVCFKFPVGMRQRINPGLDSKKCFGNMAAIATITTTAGELIEQGIGRAALRIYESVRSQSKESFKIFAKSWMENIEIENLRDKNEYDCHTLFVGGSTHFNVYENNFGWGKPIAVRSGAGTKRSGLIYIFPGTEEGSMDIHTCLPYDLIMKLLNDDEFVENITIL